jgi:hypothetical protein
LKTNCKLMGLMPRRKCFKKNKKERNQRGWRERWKEMSAQGVPPAWWGPCVL